MRVLVVEAEAGSGDAARQALEAAGHAVVGCDTPEPQAPCRGLATLASCPLDEGYVDVAVLQHTGTELTSSERGALCAARHRVPVVIDGDHRRAVTFGPGTFIAGSDIVQACADAASSGAAHAAAVRRELLCSGVIEPADVAGRRAPIVFSVRRQHDGLRLTIALPADDGRRAAIVRAATESLRRFDPQVTVIDVEVVES